MLADHLWKAYGSFAIAKLLLRHILSTFFSLHLHIIILFRFCQTRWVEDRPVDDRALEVWPSVLKVIKYWERLCKSSRPSIKSYQVVVDHYADRLIPCKFHRTFFILIKWRSEQPLKLLLKIFKLPQEKKHAFHADCRVVVVNMILKLVEKTPMSCSFVRSSTCLAPKKYCK